MRLVRLVHPLRHLGCLDGLARLGCIRRPDWFRSFGRLSCCGCLSPRKFGAKRPFLLGRERFDESLESGDSGFQLDQFVTHADSLRCGGSVSSVVHPICPIRVGMGR